MNEIDKKTIKDFCLFLVGVILITSVLTGVFGSFYTVPAGHRGVLLTLGKVDMNAKEEGFGFKIPLIQSVKDIEVRTQKFESTSDSASLDLQDVQTVIALNYHLNPNSVPRLYQNIGLDYKIRIIDPAIQESVKAITANYQAEELITKRPEVKSDIRASISERLKKYNIVVDDFNIVNFQFSEEFDAAVEQKVTAEQLKLKAQKDLERIVIEKEQTITQAQAEAEALRLQKQVITPELIELRKIEMMTAAINKWNGIMPEATNGMPFIDITPSSMS